jgi:hypothetical protein
MIQHMEPLGAIVGESSLPIVAKDASASMEEGRAWLDDAWEKP